MRPTILLVDDDQSVVKLYSRAIHMRGFDVIADESAEAALERLRAESFRLIISDVRMGGMDGYAFCRTLVENGQKTCPLIFATADDEIATIASVLDAGGDDLIIKGSAFDDIMARVTFWFASRFPGLPPQARMKALEQTAQCEDRQAPASGLIRIDRALIDEVVTILTGELAKMPSGYGDRLVERIMILGHVSRLIIDRCSGLGLTLRFADHLVACVAALRLPFGDDLNVLFARYNELLEDERFQKAAKDGLQVIEF